MPVLTGLFRKVDTNSRTLLQKILSLPPSLSLSYANASRYSSYYRAYLSKSTTWREFRRISTTTAGISMDTASPAGCTCCALSVAVRFMNLEMMPDLACPSICEGVLDSRFVRPLRCTRVHLLSRGSSEPRLRFTRLGRGRATAHGVFASQPSGCCPEKPFSASRQAASWCSSGVPDAIGCATQPLTSNVTAVLVLASVNRPISCFCMGRH